MTTFTYKVKNLTTNEEPTIDVECALSSVSNILCGMIMASIKLLGEDEVCQLSVWWQDIELLAKQVRGVKEEMNVAGPILFDSLSTEQTNKLLDAIDMRMIKEASRIPARFLILNYLDLDNPDHARAFREVMKPTLPDLVEEWMEDKTGYDQQTYPAVEDILGNT